MYSFKIDKWVLTITEMAYLYVFYWKIGPIYYNNYDSYIIVYEVKYNRSPFKEDCQDVFNLICSYTKKCSLIIGLCGESEQI